jgi:hypothetical protein
MAFYVTPAFFFGAQTFTHKKIEDDDTLYWEIDYIDDAHLTCENETVCDSNGEPLKGRIFEAMHSYPDGRVRLVEYYDLHPPTKNRDIDLKIDEAVLLDYAAVAKNKKEMSEQSPQALKILGALDFLPKVTYDVMSDVLDGSEALAYMYWGALLIEVENNSFLSKLPDNVQLIDNIDRHRFLLHMALKDKKPIAIARGPMPAITSDAELLANYNGHPWFHVCARGELRTEIVSTCDAIRRISGVKNVYLCPSLTFWYEVLVLATSTLTSERPPTPILVKSKQDKLHEAPTDNALTKRPKLQEH